MCGAWPDLPAFPLMDSIRVHSEARSQWAVFRCWSEGQRVFGYDLALCLN